MICNQELTRGMKLVPERKIKNRAKFAQMLQDNVDYLEEIDYLDDKEIIFLWKISRKVGFYQIVLWMIFIKKSSSFNTNRYRNFVEKN